MGEAGAEAIIELAHRYASDRRPKDERHFFGAYWLLNGGLSLPKEMIPVFEKYLEADSEKRLLAVCGLASVGPPAKPVLLGLLDHESYDVRLAAAKGLGRMNDKARAARRFGGEDVKVPVLIDEVLPKLKVFLRRDDGTLDKAVLDAIIGVDHDGAEADPDIAAAMRERILEAIRKAAIERK